MKPITAPKTTVEASDEDARLSRTARIAGLAYLGLGVCGALGFVLIRGKLYVSDDAARTAANLVEREGLARFAIALDLGVIVFQALAAWFFFVLFRRVHATAAGAIAAFGLVSSAALLVAAVFSSSALEVALDRSTTSAHDAQLLYHLQDSAWQVGGLFFGLWLIPMGWLVVRSGYMPRPLGWILVAGGVGYVLNSFALYLLPDATGVDALLAPSTVGEIWMIAHLLLKGVSTGRPSTTRSTLK